MQFKTLCSMAGLLLLLAVQAGAAETVRELRLEDCVRLALEQNKDYIIAEKEVEVQKAGVRAAYAARLPSLNLSGRYTMLDPGTVDDATMTVGPPFFLDGDVEIQNAYTHNWAVGLSAQYAIPWIPFFSEGGWGRARLAHQMSRRSLIVAENSLKKIRMDVQSQVKKAFYGLLIAEKVYEVTTANERRVKAYLEVSEANFNAGRVSEYDVLRSRVQLANMRPRVMMAEDTIKLATMSLLQQIGEDLDTKITVRGELDEGFITVEEKDAIEQALANRVELQELALAVEILKLQERLAAAAYKPVLAAYGNYSLDYKKPSSGGMFSTGDREFIGSWNVGIQLSIPLSELLWPRSRSHSETAKARIVTSQTELQKEKVSDFIRLEVRQAVLRLAQQYRQIGAHKEAIELSRRGVSIANQRFNAGQMSNVELMDAELDYQQAQLSYFQAWFEYISAKIDIERATGLY